MSKFRNIGYEPHTAWSLEQRAGEKIIPDDIDNLKRVLSCGSMTFTMHADVDTVRVVQKRLDKLGACTMRVTMPAPDDLTKDWASLCNQLFGFGEAKQEAYLNVSASVWFFYEHGEEFPEFRDAIKKEYPSCYKSPATTYPGIGRTLYGDCVD